MSNNATPAGYGWSSPFVWIEAASGNESSPCELLPCTTPNIFGRDRLSEWALATFKDDAEIVALCNVDLARTRRSDAWHNFSTRGDMGSAVR